MSGFSYEKGQASAAGCFIYRKAGTSHSISRPIRRRQKYRCKAGSKFYPLDGGRILLGRNRYCPTNSTMLMKNFSIVFQDVVLFNNTIMENIRVGKKDATDEEVIAAAKSGSV